MAQSTEFKDDIVSGSLRAITVKGEVRNGFNKDKEHNQTKNGMALRIPPSQAQPHSPFHTHKPSFTQHTHTKPPHSHLNFFSYSQRIQNVSPCLPLLLVALILFLLSFHPISISHLPNTHVPGPTVCYS